jgi:hypothetical protein
MRTGSKFDTKGTTYEQIIPKDVSICRAFRLVLSRRLLADGEDRQGAENGIQGADLLCFAC